jgi:hypothetical protein
LKSKAVEKTRCKTRRQLRKAVKKSEQKGKVGNNKVLNSKGVKQTARQLVRRLGVVSLEEG